MVRTERREPAGSRTLSTLEAFVVLSLSSGGGVGGRSFECLVKKSFVRILCLLTD